MHPLRILLVAALTILAAACVPPPEEEELARAYPADTLMGEIQGRGVLRAAISPGPPFASAARRGPQGFGVDMARFVADTLGVDLEVVTADAQEAVEMARTGAVDIALPLTPVTEKLARRNAVSDPYYIGHQRLLVPGGSPIESVADVVGSPTCQAIDDTGVDLKDLYAEITTIDVDEPLACVRLLRRRAETATSVDLRLMQIDAALACPACRTGDYEIVGEQLSTVGFGIVAAKEQIDLISFVSRVLAEAKSDGRWTASAIRHLAPYVADAPPPPDLTVEEAAALHPKEV